MCRSLYALLFTTALLGVAFPVQADSRGQSYPKVRTFSGGYYGPTQAHEQYQRRYGRPWHGQNGLHTGHFGHHGHGHHHSYRVPYGFGYGAVLGGWAAPSFGVYGYASPFGLGVTTYDGYPFAYGYHSGYPYPGGWTGYYPSPPPIVNNLTSPTAPQFVTPPQNPVLNDAWQENLQHWEQPLDALPIIANDRPKLPPSSPEAKGRSIHLQHQGDLLLRELKYPRAARKYRDAIAAAADRAEPHMHLAVAFAGMRNFDQAVHELKVGLSLDPSWPESGTTLDSLLHPENLLGKSQFKQAIAEWALKDVRNPDRLFLLGVVLYLDNDSEKAFEILQTTARLSGMQEYLAVFLRNREGVTPAAAQESPLTEPPAPVDPPPAPKAPIAQPELPPLPHESEPTPEVSEDTSVSTPHVEGPQFPQ